jgi:hypothetical protein
MRIWPEMKGVHAEAASIWGVLRPRQWAHFCVLVVAGVDGSSWRQMDGVFGPTLCRIAVGFACAAGLLAFAYGVNAIADRMSDLDPRKNPLAGQREVSLAMVAGVITPGLMALGLAAWLGDIALLAALISWTSGWLYSTGLRAKRIPLAGLVFNLGIFAPLMCLVLESWDSRPQAFDAWLIAFGVLLTQNQLLHELSDCMEDRRAGDRTTAQLFGALGTQVSGLVLGAIGLAGALLLASSLPARLVGCGLMVAATALVLTHRRNPMAARRWHRWACLAGGAGFWIVSMILP